MGFEYNGDNRLIRCTEAGSLVAEYVYNGLGQRVAKSVDAAVTLFVYDKDGHLILEIDADGSDAREYLYRGDNRLAMYEHFNDKLYFFCRK